jgi:predicted lactoylglutathione lyase
MFALHEGVMLGLWSRHTVQPGATAGAGAVEIGFTVDSKQAVQTLHADWTAKGLPVLQPPTQMDFGFTFTAADPDGHRLRVFVPAAA